MSIFYHLKWRKETVVSILYIKMATKKTENGSYEALILFCGHNIKKEDSILALFKIRGNSIKKCRRKSCIIAEFINLENLRIRRSFFNFWNKIMSNFWCINNTVLFFCHFPTWFVLCTQKRNNFLLKCSELILFVL